MIVVADTDGGDHEFVDGSRFFTDEHNNLCIEDANQRLISVFAAGTWHDVTGAVE